MNKDFIVKYNVFNFKIDYKNPLTIGNGNIAFTCDVTGLQSFCDDYNIIPLCTMTNRIWIPTNPTKELRLEEFKKRDLSSVYYMTDKTNQEDLYDQIRKDNHKFNLFRLGFLNLDKSKISNINQVLDLYTGEIISKFNYLNKEVEVKSICGESDCFRFEIKSEILDQLCVYFKAFEPDPSISGMKNISAKLSLENNKITVKNNSINYDIVYNTNGNVSIKDDTIYFKGTNSLVIEIGMETFKESKLDEFWSCIEEIDTLNEVLNERYVKSIYLLKVNCCGIYPPSETGLTCNSWYGKFHLEMHLIHLLGMIKIGAGKYVLPSIKYYLSIYESAIKRAKFQGYDGCRWPKMTDPTGKDAPSNIGCLLVWQQPHILIMLSELIKYNPDLIDYSKFIEIVKSTVDFICSFFVIENNEYVLDKPLIACQENHKPSDCDSPIFEVEYLRHSLIVAKKLYDYFNLEYPQICDEIISKAINPKVVDGCYLAHQTCYETYTTYNNDHPIVVFPYSYFISERLDKLIMQNTYNKVKETYDLKSMWGWDFPFMALCAYHLGDKSEAIEMLLFDAGKNTYLKNGHNMQDDRVDLPLYLPGNGAFVLAIKEIFAK